MKKVKIELTLLTNDETFSDELLNEINIEVRGYVLIDNEKLLESRVTEVKTGYDSNGDLQDI